MTALYQLVSQYRQLQEIDAEEIPEEVLRDTLEALTGELEVKATNVAMFCENLDTFAGNCKEAAKRMNDRAAKIQRKADQVRAYLKQMLEAAEITRIEAPEFTLAIKKNPPSLVIADGTKLPHEYVEIVTSVKTKTNDIKAALKAGEVIEGCRLEQGTRLEIKV